MTGWKSDFGHALGIFGWLKYLQTFNLTGKRGSTEVFWLASDVGLESEVKTKRYNDYFSPRNNQHENTFSELTFLIYQVLLWSNSQIFFRMCQ